MTKKRKSVLEAIKELQREEGREVSYQEVADFLEAPKSTVQFHIENLRRDGYLEEGATTVQRGNEIPLLGSVAAGEPIEKHSHNEYIEVPSQFLKSDKQHYALQVEGDSMIEAYICDGDFVVIRKEAQARDGQIVVANVNGSSTLKKLRKKRGQVELHPANEKYDPITVKASEDFRIEGVLAGVLRQME